MHKYMQNIGVRNGTYTFGEARMGSSPSLRAQCCLRNSSNVGLIDAGPFLSFS